jgi:hypothetical protein
MQPVEQIILIKKYGGLNKIIRIQWLKEKKSQQKHYKICNNNLYFGVFLIV